MKSILIIAFAVFVFITCDNNNESIQKSNNDIIGTWKLIYGEVKENDSLTIKDISESDFVKIINKSHFAYFNQGHQEPINFYGAGGTYTLENNIYTEKLSYTAWGDYRNRNFSFTVEISKDSLIQYGIEEVKEKGIKRYVIEKYIRIK